MPWSFANVLIQIVAGILGGHAAAVTAKGHRFGAFGHTLAGAGGGALSGLLLQTLVATVVTATGSLNEPRPVEQFILQALAGTVAGGIATLIVGFLKHSIDEHRS